jgi:hypothetical protein
MKRIIVGALLSLTLLSSPLWARSNHRGSYHGDWHHNGWHQGNGWNWYGFGLGYGLGYLSRPWYYGRGYVGPTYVAPQYPVQPDYQPTYRDDPGPLVNAWYDRYLGRGMDSGASSWMNELHNGAEPALLLSQIMSGEEYYRRAGATPRRFVEQVYADVAGRRPSGDEMDYALRRLAPSGRQGVAYAVIQQYPEALLIR